MFKCYVTLDYVECTSKCRTWLEFYTVFFSYYIIVQNKVRALKIQVKITKVYKKTIVRGL